MIYQIFLKKEINGKIYTELSTKKQVKRHCLQNYPLSHIMNGNSIKENLKGVLSFISKDTAMVVLESINMVEQT